MRIIECDRCHKRIGNDKEKTGYVNLDMRDTRTGELEGNREFEEKEFTGLRAELHKAVEEVKA